MHEAEFFRHRKRKTKQLFTYIVIRLAQLKKEACVSNLSNSPDGRSPLHANRHAPGESAHVDAMEAYRTGWAAQPRAAMPLNVPFPDHRRQQFGLSAGGAV